MPATEDWHALMRDYTPKIRVWLRHHGIGDHDAEDITQDVMGVLIRRIGEFQRQRTGSFRRWVRSMTVNCMRDHMRRENKSPRPKGGSEMVQILCELSDDQSELSRLWDHEHSQHLLTLILQRIRPEFRETTWEAFTKVAIQKVPPPVVAQELGLSVNAVFVAKSRVLKRLRQEGTGLIDE